MVPWLSRPEAVGGDYQTTGMEVHTQVSRVGE